MIPVEFSCPDALYALLNKPKCKQGLSSWELGLPERVALQ